MERELATMHQVYLSLGSNINRQENIKRCLERLSEQFGEVCSSPVYESEAVGFNGDCFFNLVVKIQTTETLVGLSASLKEIEHEHGRVRSEKRFSSRTLDIDILLYDDLKGLHAGIQLPRPEVYYNAFVLLPLANLAPELNDPLSGVHFARLWAEKAPHILTKQKLWPIEFDWPERVRLASAQGGQDYQLR